MSEAEAALLTWLRERGGFLAATVRAASAGRPRGVFADRDHEGAWTLQSLLGVRR